MSAHDLSTDRLGARRDDVYAALLAAHEGLSLAQSAALNVRLVLLLANVAGDAEAVIAACGAARASCHSRASGNPEAAAQGGGKSGFPLSRE